MMMTTEATALTTFLVDEPQTMTVITTGSLLTAVVMMDIVRTMDHEDPGRAADTTTPGTILIAGTAIVMTAMTNPEEVAIEMTAEEAVVDTMTTTDLTNMAALAALRHAKTTSTGRNRPPLCS